MLDSSHGGALGITAFPDLAHASRNKWAGMSGYGLKPAASAYLLIPVRHLLSRALGWKQVARSLQLGLATCSLPATGVASWG